MAATCRCLFPFPFPFPIVDAAWNRERERERENGGFSGHSLRPILSFVILASCAHYSHSPCCSSAAPATPQRMAPWTLAISATTPRRAASCSAGPAEPSQLPMARPSSSSALQPRVAGLRLYEFDTATGKTRELLTPEAGPQGGRRETDARGEGPPRTDARRRRRLHRLPAISRRQAHPAQSVRPALRRRAGQR